MSHLKGIAFESRDELEELRKRLSGMSDEQLVRFGKAARSLCRDPKCPAPILAAYGVTADGLLQKTLLASPILAILVVLQTARSAPRG